MLTLKQFIESKGSYPDSVFDEIIKNTPDDVFTVFTPIKSIDMETVEKSVLTKEFHYKNSDSPYLSVLSHQEGLFSSRVIRVLFEKNKIHNIHFLHACREVYSWNLLGDKKKMKYNHTTIVEDSDSFEILP